MILVAAWALVVNITQEYGLHDQFGIVFICGSAAIVVIAVLGTALIVRKLPASRRVVPLEAFVSLADLPEVTGTSTKPVHDVIDSTQPPS